MSSSFQFGPFSSAASKIWACLIRCAAPFPLETVSSNCLRSARLSVTINRFSGMRNFLVRETTSPLQGKYPLRHFVHNIRIGQVLGVLNRGKPGEGTNLPRVLPPTVGGHKTRFAAASRSDCFSDSQYQCGFDPFSRFRALNIMTGENHRSNFHPTQRPKDILDCFAEAVAHDKSPSV